MIERNEGHYVAVGSLGCFNAMKGASLYIATKHGLLGKIYGRSLFKIYVKNKLYFNEEY